MKTASIKRIALAVIIVLAMCGSVLAGWSDPIPIIEINTAYNDIPSFLSFDGLTLYFARSETDTFYYTRIYQATRTQPYGPFTSVEEISTLNYSVGHVYLGWVSPDNLRMYYLRVEAGSIGRLKFTERASIYDPWQPGINISELNALGSVYDPSLTEDELTIFFTGHNLPGNQGAYDIWMATRPDRYSPFGNVKNLTEINTSDSEFGPRISPDALVLYFISNRYGTGQAFRATRASVGAPFANLEHLSFLDCPGCTIGSTFSSSDGMALYSTKRVNGQQADGYVSYWDSGPPPPAGWTEPAPLNEVNTEYCEWTPFLSFDALTLYFARGHGPAFYDFRIFEATRPVPYGPFTSVGEINGTLNSSSGNVLSPWVSPDNLRMYYFTESNLVYNLKVTERSSDNSPWPIGTNISGLDTLGGRPQAPCLTADELTIVFASYQAPGGIGGYDLWMADRSNRYLPFGNIRNLTEINTAYKETKPYISPNGLSLYFMTDRNGSGQLFRATRVSLSEPFENLEHLSFFDAPRGGGHPSLSSDGTALYMAKTISGIEDIYVSYKTPTPAPIAHWKFDEGSGTVAYDSAGSNHGTIYGAAWTTGKIGGALDFDGVDDYVLIPNSAELNPTDITVATWIKVYRYPGIAEFFVWKYNGIWQYSAEYSIGTHPDGRASFNLAKGNLTNEAAFSNEPLLLDQWYHLAGTYNAQTQQMKFYADGIFQESKSWPYGIQASTEPLRIGSNLDVFYFNGLTDEVRIYDRALTAEEIAQIYAPSGENLLVNGGFETTELISGGWPSSYGDWSGDHSYILPRYGDVWPHEGSRLLQFVGTDEFGSGPEQSGQVYQIVDVNTFGALIAEGRATASASAYFNRLPGDAETDTEFYLDIRAFEGDPCLFPTLQDMGGMHLAAATASIFTDGDPATWQLCQTQLVLPTNTDYVVVGINARENIFNDMSLPEFDGHCADAVSLTITIEPNVPEPEGIYYVDGINGSDDSNGLTPQTAFATIQKGIDTATDGNTVIVYPAVYNEALFFNSKAITLQGVPGPTGAPILQKTGDYAVSLYSVEGPDSMLKNFIIRDSDLGIFIVGGSPTISNVTVVDNVFGIAAYANANPDISNSIIFNNTDGGLFGDPDPIQAKYSFVQDDVNGPNMPLTGLVSNWKFDEASGPIAYDSAGTNHGTIYGPTWSTGKLNGALSFDGVDDYVQVPNSPELNPTNITVATWVKVYRYPGVAEFIVWKYNGIWQYAEEYAIARHPDGRAYFTLAKGNLTNEHAFTNEQLLPGQWYHLAGTYNAQTQQMKFYADGIFQESKSWTYGVQASTEPLRIGSHFDVLYFNGLIDEVRIYDRALSAEEIKQLYQPLGDPLFADEANDDYHLLSERGRHWPAHDVWVLDKVTSPCIDGGDPLVDPAGEPMPNGGRINMGAYGGTPYASMKEWPLKHDSNFDGIVNMRDLAELALEWLQGVDVTPQTPAPPPPPPLPSQASNPNPLSGAADIDRNADLSWTPGTDAYSHDVYFGASSPPAFRGNQTVATFDPGTMAYNTMYFWRIDEVNSSGTTTGTVWSFTTEAGAPPPPPPP